MNIILFHKHIYSITNEPTVLANQICVLLMVAF